MSGYFWNSNPTPAPPAGGGTGGTWGGWGGMYNGPHGIQGAAGAGGAVPPTPLPWIQNLLANQGGPIDRINLAGLGTMAQQMGFPAPPSTAVPFGHGVSFGGGHSPLTNPGGTGTSGYGQNPSYGTGNSTAGNPGEGPYPGASGAQNWFGPPGSPAPPWWSAFQQYASQRFPGWVPPTVGGPVLGT